MLNMITTILLSLFTLASTFTAASGADGFRSPEIPLVPPRIPQDDPKSLQGHHEFVGDSECFGGPLDRVSCTNSPSRCDTYSIAGLIRIRVFINGSILNQKVRYG